MYLVLIDHEIYAPWRQRGFTLVDALCEVYNAGNAQILRLDDHTVVHTHASRTGTARRAPRGRVVMRRRATTPTRSRQAAIAA